MKKYFPLVLIFLSHASYCQDLNNLDNKMGFNKFKLESSYDLYKSQLQYYLTGTDKVVYYKYIGNDIIRVFNVFVKDINLGFYNNILYTISIDFIVIDINEERKLRRELQELFGSQELYYNVNNGEMKYEWVMTWESRNVYLQINKNYNENKYYPCDVDLFLLSKKLRIEMKNTAF